MTILICCSAGPHDTRYTASGIETFRVIRGAASRHARRIDGGGQAIVDELIANREIERLSKENQTYRVRGGHGVTIKYPTKIRTVHAHD